MFRIGGKWLRYDGPRPTSMREALELSIAKWEFLVENPGVHDGGIRTCGLCMFYGLTCKGCPVAGAGYPGCEGTPYGRYLNSRQKDDAIAELEFLESLPESADESA